LVTWTQVSDNGNSKVFGQRFDIDAKESGVEFEIGKIVNKDTSTLILDSDYADINFDVLASSNSDIKTIDMSEGNYIIHDVELSDVLVMSDETNDLIFVGDNGDKIVLKDSSEWVKSEETVKIENRADEFFEYVNKKDPTAKLFIDEDISVI